MYLRLDWSVENTDDVMANAVEGGHVDIVHTIENPSPCKATIKLDELMKSYSEPHL